MYAVIFSSLSLLFIQHWSSGVVLPERTRALLPLPVKDGSLPPNICVNAQQSSETYKTGTLHAQQISVSRPVTSWGRQGGKTVFKKGLNLPMSNSFKLYPTHFSMGVEKNFRGLRLPCATPVTGLAPTPIILPLHPRLYLSRLFYTDNLTYVDN